jgi:hypothetical protein
VGSCEQRGWGRPYFHHDDDDDYRRLSPLVVVSRCSLVAMSLMATWHLVLVLKRNGVGGETTVVLTSAGWVRDLWL